MRQDGDTLGAAADAPVPPYIDGVLYNGVDHAAAQRAHARALTTARQAAERSHAGPAATGTNRAATLHAELARIDAAHRSWLAERGESVAARPRRTRRLSATAPPGPTGGPDAGRAPQLGGGG